MRKLFIILIAVFLMFGTTVTVMAQSGSRRDPGVGNILGQRGTQDEGNKIFRMVRYVQVILGASTLAADSIVIWDLTADDGVTITTTTTSSDSAVAGIIVQQALTQDTNGNTAIQDRGKDNWTWLQTYGLSKVDFVATVGVVSAAGNSFGTSTTAGEAAQYLPSTTDPGLQGKAGFAYDTATAGDNDVQVFIIGLD